MCTVTFIPRKDKVFITSNRDEAILRTPASLPEAQDFIHGKILFPKDGKAGGTWIAMHNNGNAMVLLNGAFERHIPAPPYRKSRGLIFLDICDADIPTGAFEQIDLHCIEPFTLVIWQNNQLWEARWDGEQKYLIPKPSDTPHIWSSVTLYDKEVIALRKSWFRQWLGDKRYFNGEDIRHFHEFGGNGDQRNDLRMNRDNILMTVSITGIELTAEKGIMHYKDITAGLLSINEWHFSTKHHIS